MNWKFFKNRKNSEQEESVTNDLYYFLKILAKNSSGYIKREENLELENYVRRSEKELAKIFGEQKRDNLIDLCFEQGYIRRESVKSIPNKKGFEKDFYAIRIQGKGLKYLEEYEREGRKENTSKGIVKANYILAGATIALVIITGIYAGLVYQQNKIVTDQFISENSPTFYIDSITNVKKNGNELLFDLTILNIGNSPGRLLKIQAKAGESGCSKSESILKEFSQKTLILPGKSKTIASLNYTSTPKNETLEIIINYIGIKESGNKVQMYTEVYNIDENKNIKIDEGKI